MGVVRMGKIIFNNFILFLANANAIRDFISMSKYNSASHWMLVLYQNLVKKAEFVMFLLEIVIKGNLNAAVKMVKKLIFIF